MRFSSLLRAECVAGNLRDPLAVVGWHSSAGESPAGCILRVRIRIRIRFLALISRLWVECVLDYI